MLYFRRGERDLGRLCSWGPFSATVGVIGGVGNGSGEPDCFRGDPALLRMPGEGTGTAVGGGKALFAVAF